MDLLDEVAEHGFRDFEVGDHAVLHRPDGHDVAGRAPEHTFGFFTDSQNVRCARLNRDH